MKKSVRKIKTIDQNTTVLRADDSEEVNYNFPGFPAYIRRGLLSHYPDYSFISHWHEDLEFIVVFSGEMQYNVNGEILTLQAGEGLVVSSRQLHYGFSDEHRECDFLCVLLHPLLFCSTPAVEQAYIAPLRDAPPFAWLKLRKEQEWQQELMSLLIQMDEKSQEPHPLLALQSLGFAVWDLLFSHTLGENTTEKKHVPRQLTALKDMLHFIQVHYDDKISLEEIAEMPVKEIVKRAFRNLFGGDEDITPETPEYRAIMGLVDAAPAAAANFGFELGEDLIGKIRELLNGILYDAPPADDCADLPLQ